jgi:hypothetical protein
VENASISVLWFLGVVSGTECNPPECPSFNRRVGRREGWNEKAAGQWGLPDMAGGARDPEQTSYYGPTGLGAVKPSLRIFMKLTRSCSWEAVRPRFPTWAIPGVLLWSPCTLLTLVRTSGGENSGV